MSITAGKLSEILRVVYSTTEALAPLFEPGTLFARWRKEDSLATADASESFRKFRVGVPQVKRGSLQDSSTYKSKCAVVQVSVNYPASFIMAVADDPDGLGVEAIRPDDGALIENAFCYKKPFAFEAIQDVRSTKWLGSGLVGRAWVVSFEIEYLEQVQ